MLCPNCSSKMTVLFYDVVCDHCNPPGTSYLGNNKANPKDLKYHYGYIVCDDPNDYGYELFVFENLDKAKSLCETYRPFVVKVASKYKFLYRDTDGSIGGYDYLPKNHGTPASIDNPDNKTQIFFQEIAYRY